ncbi:MAG TPA: porin [Steroidobacteraceae bacterium]|nr:porin [Steroidobacteraceae bacterium]
MNFALCRAATARTVTLAGALSVILGTANVHADEVGDLEQRLDAQDQKIKILERKLELTEEAGKATTPSTPVIKAGPKGFSIGSSDGAHVFKLRGLLHFDGRRFNDDVTSETADTWILRRVRPTFEGTLDGIYDFKFVPDFAGGKAIIQDAYVVAKLKPWAHITAGKFKVPIGLERIQSASDIRFIERGLPTSLVPNRDLGLQLGGDLAGGSVSYSIGYFNGVSNGSSSDANTPSADVENDTKGDWAARVFVQPFANSDRFALRGLGFGIGATYVDSTGNATTALLPTYKTPGQQNFFSFRITTASATGSFADGKRERISPQAYYSVGSFGVLAEYARVSQEVSRIVGTAIQHATLDDTAWQVQLAWFATGEDETFKGFTPLNTFSLENHTWGAFEFVARYHQLDIDDDAFTGGASSFANPDTSASKATAWGIGVNWYLNRNCKWALNYDVTRFDGGASGADRPDEKALFTRFALTF